MKKKIIVGLREGQSYSSNIISFLCPTQRGALLFQPKASYTSYFCEPVSEMLTNDTRQAVGYGDSIQKLPGPKGGVPCRVFRGKEPHEPGISVGQAPLPQLEASAVTMAVYCSSAQVPPFSATVQCGSLAVSSLCRVRSPVIQVMFGAG